LVQSARITSRFYVSIAKSLLGAVEANQQVSGRRRLKRITERLMDKYPKGPIFRNDP